MKTSVFILFTLLFCHQYAWSQLFDFSPTDTLKYNFRTGGAIDTFDLVYAFPYSTIPTTGFTNALQLPTVDLFKSSTNLFAFTLPNFLDKKKVSALPHLGFMYSFGLKGTQFIHTEYQHFLKKNTLLNFDYNRQSSNGFTTNSQYVDNYIKLGLYRDYKRTNITVRAAYVNSEHGLNDGIDSTGQQSLLDTLGLTFATVQNSTAFSEIKGVHGNVEVAYNISKDSSHLSLGPLFESNYKLFNRIYEDASDTTRDQFQDAGIRNGLGWFIKNKSIFFGATSYHRYWRLQNSGTTFDTNEIGVKLQFNLVGRNFKLESKLNQNLVGAKQEFNFTNRVFLTTGIGPINFWANFSDLLPTPMQRSYVGKGINYTTALSKQSIFDIGGAGNIKRKNTTINYKLGYYAWANNFVWVDSVWAQNQNSSFQVFYLESQAHLNLGLVHWFPRVTVQTGSSYLPTAVFSGRILIKKKVFEAKKLELVFSLDPQVNTSYKMMSFYTPLDNFMFNSDNRMSGQNYALHSSFTLGIDEFRFFIRAENLQSFWTSGSREVLQNYYGSPFVLRLGFSWDFFN